MNTIPSDTTREQAEALDAVMPEIIVAEEMAEEMAEAARAKRQQALDDLGASLEKAKDIALAGRTEVEKRWLDDLRQYHAEPDKIEGTKESIDAQEYRRTNDNITRSKVLLVAARLGDMLFPTNDANWDLEHSPSPSLPPGTVPKFAEDGVTPLTPEQIRVATLDAAKSAAEAMKTEVADNLAESDYPSHGRSAIFQAAQLGSGVIKGPYTRMRKQTTWAADGSSKRGYTAIPAPGCTSVDVWNFFPQPSRNMEECEHVFELHMMPPMKLRRLAKQPGFDKEQINRLLGVQPDMGKLRAMSGTNRGEVGGTEANTAGRYPVWEYTGPIPKEALIAFVTNMAEAGSIEADQIKEIAEILDKDNLTQVDAEIWMSQGIVLKAMLRAMRDAEGTGYYVYNYEQDPDNIFGYGVPYLCRDDAIAANQVWHAIMLNTMMSAGPQIGVRKDALEATTGKGHDLSCTKPRVWVMTDEVTDINDAITVFNIPNVVGRMMPVYERIKLNADEHTMMPMVAQGEATAGVPTTGGMAMLMNAANVVMRRLAKQWDDNVTMPLISEHVAWNEQHSQKTELRGDCMVIAKGASHLLIKDIQAQHIQFATQLFTSNPLLAPYMKAGQWARANIDILELSGKDMLYTDAEVAATQAKQAEQQNPEVIKAMALTEQAQAATTRAQAEATAKQADIEFRKWDRQMDNQERMHELNIRAQTMEMQLQAARFNYLHKLAALDAKERIDMAGIARDLNIAEADQRLQKYSTDFRGQLDAQKLVNEEKKTEIEIAVESPNPRLA